MKIHDTGTQRIYNRRWKVNTRQYPYLGKEKKNPNLTIVLDIIMIGLYTSESY